MTKKLIVLLMAMAVPAIAQKPSDKPNPKEPNVVMDHETKKLYDTVGISGGIGPTVTSLTGYVVRLQRNLRFVGVTGPITSSPGNTIEGDAEGPSLTSWL